VPNAKTAQRVFNAVGAMDLRSLAWGTICKVDRKEVERNLAATEKRSREVRARLEHNAARLTELEEERAALLGDSKLAERAAADYETRLHGLREELATVMVREAREEVQQAIRARDAAIAHGANAAAELAAGFQQLAKTRADLRKAHQRLRGIDPEAPRALPPEPAAFKEQWRAVAPMVEAELGVQLETEIVEAAVRSPNFLLIDELPVHLRELARQRKQDLQRARDDGPFRAEAASDPHASRITK
jgi:hypothetical protein